MSSWLRPKGDDEPRAVPPEVEALLPASARRIDPATFASLSASRIRALASPTRVCMAFAPSLVLADSTTNSLTMMSCSSRRRTESVLRSAEWRIFLGICFVYLCGIGPCARPPPTKIGALRLP